MSDLKPKTLVLGASTNPGRYSFLATERLIKSGHECVLVGKSAGMIFGLPIQTQWPDKEEIDTITMYLAAHNQIKYYDTILESHARRIIFNPGAENNELEKLAIAAGIRVDEACTLVLLATDQY